MSSFCLPLQSKNYSLPRGAFTLIELLVAVAVIAILAAFSIPAISTVRANANTAKCTGNLRSIGVGLSLLAQDNNNRLPQTSSVNQQNYRWRPDADSLPENARQNLLSFRLVQYGVSPEAFECPEGLNQIAVNEGRPVSGSHYRRVHWVLDHDGVRIYPFRDGESLVPLHEKSESPPSQVILIYDAVVPGNPNFMHKPPHRGKRNFLFLDGSVRTLSEEEEPTFG